MEVLLGLDLGTTNCKALAFDTKGRLAARASAPTPSHSASIQPASVGGPLSPTYDAEQLWQVSARLIRLVGEQLRPGQRVVAVSIASMGESGVLVDGAGRPLSRQAALRKPQGRGIDRELAEKGIVARCRSWKGRAEEQPDAYKDVSVVVDVVDRAGLAKKVARLRPVGVVKG